MTIKAPKPKLPPISPILQACATYVPGKPVEELQRELGLSDIIKLASNENPLGPSPIALKAIENEIANIHFYPDVNHFYLRQKLAARLGVTAQELIIGNGSEEVVSLLIRSYCSPGDNTVGCGAAFLAYRVCSQVHGVEDREPALNRDMNLELEELLSLVDAKTRIVFLPNPNNPTGTYLNRVTMRKLLQRLQERSVLVMLDYAYWEYVRTKDLPSPEELYAEFPNVLVTRTFSKIYGLAGLRVGYGMAHPDILETMRKVKMPFNVTTLGLAAALAALEDEAHVKRSYDLNVEGIEYLEKEFQRMGLDFWPSQANFLLVRMPVDAKQVYDKMLTEGVILRPVANYRLPEFLRVSVGTMSQNKRMIASLEKTLRGFKA